ncbi:hypothetical protein PJ985_08030 [Streptomyces sp. ACA25]|uniref:hypothetical protein n=1 Tax=Streptomyces sp. ACA25 TaxID=3022596 RepID=UPI0023074E52|nr:hypothetical protein [Streptomyces sp. ACA25]MDB1087512.1 hypothetical protein [Streptomyces sp. ACA25]
MLRQLVHAGTWAAATAAAVALSWFGVTSVLKGTVHDPPRALPVSHAPSWAGPQETDTPAPDASSTHRPRPEPPAAQEEPDGGRASGESPEPGTGQPSSPVAQDPPAVPATTPAEQRGDSVETVRTDGGRVAFALAEESAELVSASPEAGWEMQVWEQDAWIRVTFSAGDRALSVFCTWNGHPPRIDFHEE